MTKEDNNATDTSSEEISINNIKNELNKCRLK